MKRLSVACGALALGLAAGNAFAADLPVKAVVPAPVFSWTGPYIGVNLGYSWGSETASGTVTGETVVATTVGGVTTTTVTPLTPLPLVGGGSLNGLLGGAQLGYNWQVTNWLVGLEGDFQGTGERRTISICTAVGCPTGSVLVTPDSRLTWFGTDRVRVGWLPTERVILYGTAGLAYGTLRSEAGPIAFSAPTSLRAGWTAGGGIETALDSNWSFKLEYLYMDFGNIGSSTADVTTAATVTGGGRTTVTTVIQNLAFSTRFTDNIVRIGFNYRFGTPAAVVAKY